LAQDAFRISLKQARTIEAVANARGFEQAARLLNTSQPVVSRTIASAEELLGVSLFQRGWGGTEPTSFGETVIQRCKAATKLIRDAERDMEALVGERPNLSAFLRWHHLAAIAAVARWGSASEASKRLGITQPAVSRAIAAATEYVRRPLFTRHRSGLAATDTAHRLVSLRDQLEPILCSGDRFQLDAKRGLAGRLAVGLLPFSGQELVARAFGALTGLNPELRLIAVPGSYNMLAQALQRGEIDCMMGVLRKPSPFPELREVPLYRERFTFVARHDHPRLAATQTIASLKDENWIVAPHGTPVRRYFERLFQEAGATPPAQTCEILSFGSAEKVIMNSNAIGVLSYSSHHIENLPPGLRRIDVELPDAEMDVGLTMRLGYTSNAILDTFEEMLRALVREIGVEPAQPEPAQSGA